MMVALPDTRPDPELLSICREVGRGRRPVADGISQLQRRLHEQRRDSSDLNRLTVIAVLLVEHLLPRTRGVLMNRAQMEEHLLFPDPVSPDQADAHISFLFCACLQVTATGHVRDGASQMRAALDLMLPE